MSENFLTTSEAAARSGRSTKTIYRKVYAGELPAVKHGNELLIDPADVDRVFAPKPLVPKSGAATEALQSALDDLIDRALLATPPIPADRLAGMARKLQQGGAARV